MKKYVIHTTDWLQLLNVDGDVTTLYNISTGYDMFMVIEAESENDPLIFELLDTATEATNESCDFATWVVDELDNDVYRHLYDFIETHSEVDFQFNECDMQTTMTRLRGKILELFCQRFLLDVGLESVADRHCYVSNDHRQVLFTNGKLYPIEALALPFFGEKILLTTKTPNNVRRDIHTQEMVAKCLVEEVATIPAVLAPCMFKGHEFWPNKPVVKEHPMARPD